MYALFGLGSYYIALFIGWFGWRLLFSKSVNNLFGKIFWIAVFLASFCTMLSLIEDSSPIWADAIGETLAPQLWTRKNHYHLGGAPAYYFYHDLHTLNLRNILNTTGTALICACGMLTSFLFLAKIHPMSLVSMLKAGAAHFKPTWPKWEPKPQSTEPGTTTDFLRFVKLRIPNQAPSTQEAASTPAQQELLAIQPETNLKVRPSLSRKEVVEAPPLQLPFTEKPKKREPIELPLPPQTENKEQRRQQALAAQRVHNGDFKEYKLPALNLLSNPKKVDQSLIKKDLKRQAEVLEETLHSFNIEAKVGQINCGPTITSFEVHPSIGVKVQKIKALENDIALNMEAKSIRIIAPIPGKAAVGIEVPNATPQEVGFKDMLSAYQQGGRKFHVPILLGKAVNGDYVMSDLTKMPHCIIAGATGSGKSVCINTIVMSILHNAKPDEIKLIMVDPKKVELTPYTRLPHMLAPVITEPLGACAALNWMVKEMENRYEILKLVSARNIEAFNTRTPDTQHEQSLGREIPAKMPYIVGIIDELADLMMVASNDIETPIARIAQMARAVGIHLILATQRPSREVITGLIKANFPTRISFKVASRVNSQIVLDETGAETLLGNGDMLFLPPGTSHLTRAQGAFIRDEDILATIKSICDQAPPNYVIESFDRIGYQASDDGIDEPTDDLYSQAVDTVLGTGNASTTFLQRKLKIGYARAASLIDEMEARGIVGPADGSKPRKILVSRAGASADTEQAEASAEV
jgi:S-DNA-T family DNA segregation ATPase FtsK/SpoIIIE